MSIPTVERRRFKVGKYDIIAHPIPNSAHMLRYTVFVGGKRIGATVSVPTESDCRFLEKPPVVPPLKIFSSYRPGRPKKGSRGHGDPGAARIAAARYLARRHPRNDRPLTVEQKKTPRPRAGAFHFRAPL
jgi:hypothetical protein